MLDRPTFKRVIAAMFDSIAEEHPRGHQNVYACRYLLRGSAGRDLEIMFESAPEKTPANIWVLSSVAAPLVRSGVAHKSSPASKLRTTLGKDGKPNYGRHSALETMPQLGDADLVYFSPVTLEEVGRIVDALLAAAGK
jgi:hypothetical protein